MKYILEDQAQRAQKFVYHMAHLLEILVAIIVIVSILISLLRVPESLLELFYSGGFNEFLKSIFNLIIGIELLKMFCRHDLDSVVEVLLFAVAREMIIEQRPLYETLVGVISIGILFSIRKYLFVSALDKTDGSASGN